MNMKRREFLSSTGIATGALLIGPSIFSRAKANPLSRIGLTTVVFRNQFANTNPNVTSNELTLSDIPEYFVERFGIHNLEFWSEHFESRDQSYLKDLKNVLIKNNCKLINIQADTPGKDMSDPESGNSVLAVQEIKEWIDVGKFLGSKMVRASFRAGNTSFSAFYFGLLHGNVPLLCAGQHSIAAQQVVHRFQLLDAEQPARQCGYLVARRFGGNLPFPAAHESIEGRSEGDFLEVAAQGHYVGSGGVRSAEHLVYPC